LEGLRLENVGIFLGDLEYTTTKGNFVHFPLFWYIVSRKNWQPWFTAGFWLLRQLWRENLNLKKAKVISCVYKKLVIDVDA
jgi:hypothetical protein